MSNEFTFTYDATTGVLIAAALRSQADDESKAAKANAINAQISADTGDGMETYYIAQAQLARNRAALLRSAADDIAIPVQTALAADMGEALRKAGVLED
jgi:hypothetical protein